VPDTLGATWCTNSRIDDFSSGFEWAIPSGVPVFVGDIGDLRRVAPLISKYGISEIIHFAASVVAPESVADPLRYYRNNTANSRSLFEIAIRSGVQRFIFSSTAAVYGNPPANPVTEKTPVAPVSPYGSSKFMAETMLRDASRAHGLRYIILRYFNVAGRQPWRAKPNGPEQGHKRLRWEVEAMSALPAGVDIL
jgi:UDP-glucose 4-epimerase